MKKPKPTTTGEKYVYKLRGCNCKHCISYRNEMIRVVKMCKCVCHDNILPSGHDELCCSFPNAYKDYLPKKFL